MNSSAGRKAIYKTAGGALKDYQTAQNDLAAAGVERGQGACGVVVRARLERVVAAQFEELADAFEGVGGGARVHSGQASGGWWVSFAVTNDGGRVGAC